MYRTIKADKKEGNFWTWLRAPVNVTWAVTLKCNLRCTHCLSDAGAASPHELTTEECRRPVDQLTSIHVFQVNIRGGEPFVREDFMDLLGYAHEKGLVTCVSSKGLLIEPSLARRLGRMEMVALFPPLAGR